jgi:methyl-accepting chemotaxis protein
MFLRNLSIRAKLIGAFTVVILLLIGLGALSQQGLRQINARSSEIADNWLVGVREVGTLNGEVMTYRTAVLRQMLSTGLETKKINQKIADAAQRVDEALKRYPSLASLLVTAMPMSCARVPPRPTNPPSSSP